jgi:ergothioneine biosynthesis protein EgtB
MSAGERESLLLLFTETRARTESLSSRLSAEDQQIQSMPDASPTKWHRAHTTWFFETFVLARAEPPVPAVDPRYGELWNSYYEAVGSRHARDKRGLLSRPSAADVGAYRRRVDDRMRAWLVESSVADFERLSSVVLLGVAHEEQHQELLLTDILHAFSANPLRPSWFGQEATTRETGHAPRAPREPGPLRFVAFEGGISEIGAGRSEPFAFDNERPRHKAWVDPFELADRLVTVHEWKAFAREGGYATPSLWLSEGYDFVRSQGVKAPLYGEFEDGELRGFSLAGARVAADDEPVAHVSYYEADALARFLGARLPTEAEWELAAAGASRSGNFLDDMVLRPEPPRAAHAGDTAVRQLFGDAWEWTSSSYEPYPGYVTPAGALGEYNAKFMVNQQVLRGGSCLTPRRHVRASYRNFWPAKTRFQMTGVRLARSARP